MNASRAKIIGTVIIAACIVRPATGQMGHARHPKASDQRFSLDHRVGDDPSATSTRTPIALKTPSTPVTLQQRIELPAPLGPIVVRQYLPNAKLHQDVTADDTPAGRPMTLLSIDGPTQSYDRWLVDGDPERNRLISLIGTWRFMVVKDRAQRDALFAEFEAELRREPKIHISSVDGSHTITVPSVVGSTHDLPALGGTLTVREFFTHYALSAKTNKPTNVSSKRANPGALIELQRDGQTEQRWVFSQFPDYTGGHEQIIPWKTTLDCPAEGKSERPDMAIVMVRDAEWEIWVRHHGNTETFTGDAVINVPETQYKFRLSRSVPAGRLVESYQVTTDSTGVPAFRVETPGTSDRPQSVWLTPAKPRVVITSANPVTLTLNAEGVAHGGHP